MSSPEYPEEVLEYLKAQGWTTSIKKIRDGVHIVAGSRDSNSGSDTMILMIVNEPETDVTQDHIKYLLKVGEEKKTDTGGLTTKVPTTDEAQQAIEQYDVSVIEPSTIISEIETQTGGTARKSRTQYDKQSNTAAYETCGSRLRLSLFGIISLIMGLGSLWLLLDGDFEGWRGLLTWIGGILLFLPMGVVWTYQAIKYDPVLRITNTGIIYDRPIRNIESYKWGNIDKIEHSSFRAERLRHTTIYIYIKENDDQCVKTIQLSFYGINLEEVLQEVENYSDGSISVDRLV